MLLIYFSYQEQAPIANTLANRFIWNG